MNTWMMDCVPVAGAAYRQLIDDLYRNNRLIKNELRMGGETVDLRRLRANLLTVIAERDHITPPCQSETILEQGEQRRQGDFSGPREGTLGLWRETVPPQQLLGRILTHGWELDLGRRRRFVQRSSA